jgi:hypothetical protein
MGMKLIAACVLVLVAALTSATPHTSAASSQPSDPSTTDQPQVYRATGTRIAIGRSIHVAADEEVSEAVVVVGGSARVDGRVREGVVVVGGNLDVGPRADIRGEVVVVGGRVTRDARARIRGRVSDISFGEWGSWPIAGLTLPTVDLGFGRWLGIFGTLARAAFLVIVMALFVLVARAPVARIGRSAGAEPGRAFALGLIAEVLFVPVLVVASVGLIVSIVGIPVAVLLIPTALVAGFIALLMGFTAVTCRIGEWLQDRFGWRGNSALVACVLGLAIVLGPTLLARTVGLASQPMRSAGVALIVTGVLLEFVVWTVGLGAALMTGLGRWSTAPPPLPPPIRTEPAVAAG